MATAEIKQKPVIYEKVETKIEREGGPTISFISLKEVDLYKEPSLKEPEAFFVPLKIINLRARTRFSPHVCQICGVTDECQVKQNYVPLTEDECPQPMILHCQDKPFCLASAQASKMADVAEANRFPLPEKHPLYQPYYCKFFRALDRELEQWNIEPWKIKRTNGDIESSWLIKCPVYRSDINEVYIKVQHAGTGITKLVSIPNFTILNKERLVKIAKSLTQAEWIPPIPDHYPKEKGELFLKAFEDWYKMLTM